MILAKIQPFRLKHSLLLLLPVDSVANADMVDLDVYRKRIGTFNLSKGNFRGKYVQISSKVLDNKHRLSSFVSLVNVLLCLLYLYFVTVIAALIMSMSMSISINFKPVNSLPCSSQLKNEFLNLNVAVAHIKLLFSIIITIIFNSSLLNRHIKRFLLFRLLLKDGKSKITHCGRFNKLCQSLIFWLCALNFMLITIVNPNLLNPGPGRANNNVQTRPLKIFYNNVQGLINLKDLRPESPPLNMTKLYELQNFIFKQRPDIVVQRIIAQK